MARRRIAFQGFTPLHQPHREPDHFAKEKWLGHRRGLQIEQVRIEREKRKCYDCSRGAQPMTSESIYTGAPGEIGQCRWNQSGDSIGPPCVNRNKGKHQQMGQRKPDRAKLRKARSMRIEDAASDVQVRHRVAIVQHRAVMPAPQDRKGRCCHRKGHHHQPLVAADGAANRFLSQGGSARGTA